MTTIPGPDDKLYSVAEVATVIDLLRKEGVPIERALEGTGLFERALYSPKFRVSITQILKCYRNTLKLSHDPLFAYHAGLRLHVSTYGLYGFAMLSSTNSRQTTRFAVDYHRLGTPVANFSFSEEYGCGIWTIVPLGHPLVEVDLYRYIVELHLGGLTSLHQDVLGPSFLPSEIHLAYRAPPNAPEYIRVLGCPVLFSQSRNQFVFDASWLDRPAPLGNRITHAMVVELCDALLKELDLRAGVAGKVRQAILARLPRAARFEDVAEDLTINPRTLRRRLSDEHTSYRKLAHELLAAMAIKSLRETDLTVDEIAAALGFSEVGNFRHAFRRWTGMSPSNFRDIRTPRQLSPA